ncbi:hypothetical protein BDV96DRAFT_599204 [Lophiotrema nucula]|uniref:Uncharacterized protein n=1 Tax=Lophiotrema nucula TaxID=690887 RepID=A0A6A5Z9P1_9PLEO|nr:hypothetical protein BDV96DRAFT_599204 [Lophiotrema nucula]
MIFSRPLSINATQVTSPVATSPGAATELMASSRAPFNQPAMVEAALHRISEEEKSEGQPERRRYSFEDSSSDDALTVTSLPRQDSSTSVFPPPQPLIGPFYSNEQLAQISAEDDTVMDEQLEIFDLTAFASPPIPQEQPQKPRYYSTALSQDDKQALAVGEVNHNLKLWTAKHAIRLEESRKALAPHPTYKEYMEAENGKAAKRPSIVPELAHLQNRSNRGSYLSVNTSLSATSPLSLQRGHLSVASISPLSPLGLGELRSASTGDYFSQQHRSRTHHSRSSSRILSPLSFEQRTYTPRREVTFDSMLSPHISGKGESFRGSSNAIKDDIAVEKNRKEEVKKQVAKKRLSKVPSMPVMFVRKNRNRDSAISG